jgi:hypothetical protein
MRLSIRPAFVCALLAIGSSVQAQEVLEPFETARFRWGPIAFTPVLEITSLGRDSNVFNEVSDPKSDFTAAIGPSAKVWMRPLGTRLSVTTGGQYQYFRKYSDQRAWNTTNEAKWEVPLARFTPFVSGRFANTRERQGYEIDARSRRRDRLYAAGTSFRLSGKTEIVGSYRRSEFEYDEREAFLGAALADALNRVEDSSKLQFRYALTPLTTFVTDVEVSRDRFEVSRFRDTDSVKVLPGFELKPLALISGTVFVGYRQFNPLDAGVPDYRGVVAAVKARYTRAATRLDLIVDRDIAYSFEVDQPYYALLDYGLTVTQRVTSRWDLVAQGSLQRLAYRSFRPLADVDGFAATGGHDRVDRGHIYGGGLGYRLNETTRIGFNVAQTKRESSALLRSFEGTRAFASITYGIQQ